MQALFLAVVVAVVGRGVAQLSPFGIPGSPNNNAQGGQCSARERNLAFDNCIMNFGFNHLRYFNFLARHAPNCRSEVFNCHEVDVLVQCLNSQPTTAISNNCWVMMDTVLTDALKRYNIPCTYQDLEQKCKGQYRNFLTTSQRSNTGRGTSMNPVRAIYNRISQMISMMMMLGMQGGGFGGMFAGMGGALGF